MRIQQQSRLALCKFIDAWQNMQAYALCYLRTVILSAAKDHDAWQSMQADAFCYGLKLLMHTGTLIRETTRM